MNALNNVFSFSDGLVGAFFIFVDTWGRRPMMLWGIFLSGVVYIPISILAGLADVDTEKASSCSFIAMMFLYGIISSFCIIPLQALYHAEILSNDVREKGTATDKFVGAIASFISLLASSSRAATTLRL